MRIKAIRRHYIYIPYKPPVDPYYGWKAATHGAHAVIIEMETDCGLIGWGETAGRESSENHSKCSELLIGRNPLDINENVNFLRQQGCTNIAISGPEMAMWDIVGKKAKLPVYQLLGGKVRSKIELCGLMGVKSPEDAAETAKLYRDFYGFKSIKTKSGRSIIEDENILKSIRSAVGPEVKIRSDANQNYSFNDALVLCNGVFSEYNLEYFEQPCNKNDLKTLAVLKEKSKTPIALNESVTDCKSLAEIILNIAADYLVIDIPDAGGISELSKILAVAEVFQIPCTFHCWHDMGIKTAAMTHLVSSSNMFKAASDTLFFGLKEDIIHQPFTIDDGYIIVPEAPGLGVNVNRSVLDKYRKKVID